MENTLYELIFEELNNHLDEKVTITPEDNIKEDLGLSSMKLIFFLTTITEKLDISILDFADYELLNLKTVEDMYNLLQSKKKDNE